MTTHNYKNARGYFDKCLAFDCETSGMDFGADPSKNCQMVSFGAIVVDMNTYTPIEQLYTEIKWNGKSTWSDKAEQVHGMSKEYLNKNGVTEQDAVEQLGGLLYDHFGFDTPISLLGHNVVSFDLPFLRKLLTAHGLGFKFAHRHLDTFTLGIMLKCYNSDDLFELVNGVTRKSHNALEDAQQALDVYKNITKLWDIHYG